MSKKSITSITSRIRTARKITGPNGRPLSYREIAQIAETTVATVKNILNTAPDEPIAKTEMVVRNCLKCRIKITTTKFVFRCVECRRNS